MRLSSFEIGFGFVAGVPGYPVNRDFAGIEAEGVVPNGEEKIFMTSIDDVELPGPIYSSTHFNLSMSINPNWSVSTSGWWFDPPGEVIRSAPLDPLDNDNIFHIASVLVVRKSMNPV